MIKYAYRLETRRVKEPDFPYTGKGFTYPEAVAEFCHSLQDSDVEKLIVLHLTQRMGSLASSSSLELWIGP